MAAVHFVKLVHKPCGADSEISAQFAHAVVEKGACQDSFMALIYLLQPHNKT